eukprot:2533922-Pyramimonas_sp.AAC.1
MGLSQTHFPTNRVLRRLAAPPVSTKGRCITDGALADSISIKSCHLRRLAAPPVSTNGRCIMYHRWGSR